MKKIEARSSDYCKQFKNGNILVKPDWKDNPEPTELDAYYDIIENLYWVDTYPITDGNWFDGVELHDCHNDICFSLFCGDVVDYMQGRTIRVYARTPDSWDRENIAKADV